MIDRRSFLNYKIPETWALLHFEESSASQDEVTGNEDLNLYSDDGNHYQRTSNEAKFGSYSFTSAGRSGYISVRLPQSVFTVEFWVKRTGAVWNDTGAICPLIGIYDNGKNNDGGNNKLFFQVCDYSAHSQSIAISNGAYNYNNWNIVAYDYMYNDYYFYNVSDWTHVAVTYNKSVTNIYLNGNLVIYSTGPFFNSKYWGIGYGSPVDEYTKWGYFEFGNHSYGMYGYMDELRISSKVLYTGSSFTVPSSAFTV